MVNIRIRQSESLAEPQVLLPDMVWSADEGWSDLFVNEKGALSSENSIWTAITIQLMTNLRADQADNLSESDPQGWVGDTFDIQNEEQALGSHIWTLYRTSLTDEVIRKFEQYVIISMNVLQNAGLFSRFDVEVEPDKSAGMIKLGITVFANYTQEKYSKRFELFWEQLYAS